MSYSISKASQYRQTIDRPPVLSRILLLWTVLAILAGAVILIEPRLGISLLWGCSLSLLPNAVFAWFSFRRFGGARSSALMMRGIYRAEAYKFFLTAVLFAAVFIRERTLRESTLQEERIILPILFLAFIAGQIGSWLVTAHALRPRLR